MYIQPRAAWLSSDYGDIMARRYFGDEVIDAMPVHLHGRRSGKRKGRIIWRGHTGSTGQVVWAQIEIPMPHSAPVICDTYKPAQQRAGLVLI